MWLTRPRDSGATRFAARLPLPYTSFNERDCEGKLIVISHGPNIEETKEGYHDDKVEGMEISALSTASVSCIDNMSDGITDFCD